MMKHEDTKKLACTKHQTGAVPILKKVEDRVHRTCRCALDTTQDKAPNKACSVYARIYNAPN
jgi:hypothetical protein